MHKPPISGKTKALATLTVALAILLCPASYAKQGLAVFSAVSGDIPFDKTVVTNVAVQGEGWMEPSAVTNYVDISMVRIKDETIEEVKPMLAQTYTNAMEYTDTSIETLATNIADTVEEIVAEEATGIINQVIEEEKVVRLDRPEQMSQEPLYVSAIRTADGAVIRGNLYIEGENGRYYRLFVNNSGTVCLQSADPPEPEGGGQ
jgi:hypothetical protein